MCEDYLYLREKVIWPTFPAGTHGKDMAYLRVLGIAWTWWQRWLSLKHPSAARYWFLLVSYDTLQAAEQPCVHLVVRKTDSTCLTMNYTIVDVLEYMYLSNSVQMPVKNLSKNRHFSVNETDTLDWSHTHFLYIYNNHHSLNGKQDTLDWPHTHFVNIQ